MIAFLHMHRGLLAMGPPAGTVGLQHPPGHEDLPPGGQRCISSRISSGDSGRLTRPGGANEAKRRHGDAGT